MQFPALPAESASGVRSLAAPPVRMVLNSVNSVISAALGGPLRAPAQPLRIIGLLVSGSGSAGGCRCGAVPCSCQPAGPGRATSGDSVELGAAALPRDASPGNTYTPRTLRAGARHEVPATERTAQEQQRVRELQLRDREVRQHEAAHQAAAGGHARGGAQFEYETGPDGRQYAVAGEVRIDTAEVAGDPRATIAKMRQLRAAALAPAAPSGQDRAVAAQAAARLAEAQAALAEQPAAKDAASALARDDAAEEPRSVGGSASRPSLASRWREAENAYAGNINRDSENSRSRPPGIMHIV